MNDTVAVLQAPGLDTVPVDVPVAWRWRSAVRPVAAAALAVTLLGFVFPRVVGTTLSDMRAAFGAVSGREAVVITLLWAAGLFTHSFVLTGALPGLTRRRALTLNLTGSAVSNTLPFGGAAAMSMNYVMVRSWGIDASGFAAFTLVTNVYAILLKLTMPALALAALWATGGPVSVMTRWTAAGSSAAVIFVVGIGIGALASRPLAERAVGLVAPAIARIGRLFRRSGDHTRVSAAFLTCRDTVASVLERRWGQMSAGTLGYGVLQALLLWACLHAVGASLAPAAVLAGYAVDRVLTLIFITPGGAGFTEAGTAAALIALGGSAAPVAAGVLLYRGFTFALEIPVGGAWLAGWLFQRRRALVAARAVGA